MLTDTPSPSLTPPARTAVAVALALLAFLAGIPLVLAQLDFAGVLDVFAIETDSPHAVLVLAAVGGSLTLADLLVALAAALLALNGSPLARPLLLAAAVAGFATALMLWLPCAVVLVAAAATLPSDRPPR